MDIATYDHNERSALATLESWQTSAYFVPTSFEQVRFPTRLAQIGEIRRLLAGMHGRERIDPLIAELNGLRETDLDRLARAIARYMRWFQTLLPDKRVPVPLGDFIAQYVAYTKLAGLAPRGRVLEVGAGYGLTTLFAHKDGAIHEYDLIEVTQSLYVVQASICASLYGPAFRNHAFAAAPSTRIGQLTARGSGSEALRAYLMAVPRSFRCNLFPWWEMDVPLAKRYDVIMSHANLAEMPAPVSAYYLGRWADALADGGYLLIQDLGHPLMLEHDAVLRAIDAAGFRALVKAKGSVGGKTLPCWNLLLIADRHPDYARARSVLDPQVLLADHPAVRSAFGLDRPAGTTFSVQDLGERIGAHLSAKGPD